MIRRAKFSDIPDLTRLLHATHAKSKYATRMAIHDKAAEQLLMGLIAGQTQNGPQATHVSVVEKDGKVTGFMAGALNRIYNVGDKLAASDVFIINEGSSLADFMRLVDDYIAWARSNPKVLEIGLSWTDAIPGSIALSNFFVRKGFNFVGEQFVLATDQVKAEAA